MIKRIYIILACGTLLLIGVHCREPYILPDSSKNLNILVVEGVISTGSDSTIIKLSRTVKLTDTTKFQAETGANVSLADGSGNAIYSFIEIKGGYYYLAGLNNPEIPGTYKLKVVTISGKTYLSDVLPVKNSPPIDSVTFQVKSDGIHTFSNTHDPRNATRYYRWDYTETWIIHSDFESNYEAITSPRDTVISRPPQDQIYTCWLSDNSSTIILNSSAKLSQDVIVDNPIGFVPSNSEKLRKEYSILVKQYALTEEAFNYWQNVKKNTEQLGSIFDAQPSEIAGNMHSVDNPSEPVIGYVSMGAPSAKRLFIGYSSFPQQWFRTIVFPYQDCRNDSLYYRNPKTGRNDVLALFVGGEIPFGAIVTPQAVLIGYSASSSYCVDCRFRGSNVRPSFWVDKN